MARTTTAEVKKIIDTDLTDLDAFILPAGQLVDQVAAADSSLVAAVLEEIECWLTAHFTAMRDPQAAKSTIGPTSFTYEGKTGMGLEFTRYGQMALLLDSTGTLARLSKHLLKIGISSLGYTAQDGEMKTP